MDKLRLALISATMILLLAASAAGAATQNEPLIAGQRSYTFSWGIKNPGEKRPYVFTRAELDRTTCDKTNGYYWCQAKARCLRVAAEKCKLTSSGNWYDGATSEDEANLKSAAGKATKTVRAGTATNIASTTAKPAQSGLTRVIQGTTKVSNINQQGLFGKLQPSKHGPGRADWSTAATTGRRTWGGLPAQKAIIQTVDSGLGRY